MVLLDFGFVVAKPIDALLRKNNFTEDYRQAVEGT